MRAPGLGARMDLGLKGGTVAVMAASEGLGRAAALALAREGANVALCARRREPLERAAKELQSVAPEVRVRALVADATKADDVLRFVEEAVRLGNGSLDALVYNVGGPPAGRFSELTDDQWRSAFELLVLSNVRAIRAALPHLKKPGGAIVNITSTSVKQPIPSLVLSNSLRLAVVGLAKTLAAELGPQGIRINNVCPGSMETERLTDLMRRTASERHVSLDLVRAEREREAALGRFGRPEELADVIAFLASPRAAYVTGATVSVDGGLVRWTFG